MALSASTVLQESMGSMKLHIIKFASVDTAGDTYASGIPGIVSVWANATTGSTVGKNGCSCGVTTAGATGAIFVSPAVAGSVTLFVMSKS